MFIETYVQVTTIQEEGVVLVPGWVLLRLEQSIKVPEGAFYEVVSGHLRESRQRDTHSLKLCIQ